MKTTCLPFSRMKKKELKVQNQLGLPFMVPDLLYKFQMICLKGTEFFLTDTYFKDLFSLTVYNKTGVPC